MSSQERHRKKKFVEPQPSQEPADDGYYFGKCGCICNDFDFDPTSCICCPRNPDNQESEEDLDE